jgi:hypothetical protein
MASKIKVDELETADGSGTIALQNQLSGMTGVSLPTGSVLQTLFFETSTQVSSTSSTMADAGLSIAITPSSSSSKILVLVSQGYYTNETHTHTRLLRDSTELIYHGYGIGWASEHYTEMAYEGYSYLDSPSTTSAITYKTQFKRHSGSNSTSANYDDGGGHQVSTMTVMEIAG